MLTQKVLQVVVVEEKRSFIEQQVKDTLYSLLTRDAKPHVIGKKDVVGRDLLQRKARCHTQV
jgi:TPP-dependent indolepyruvate ferredoxin oxidoreductase alpha subunit